MADQVGRILQRPREQPPRLDILHAAPLLRESFTPHLLVDHLPRSPERVPVLQTRQELPEAAEVCKGLAWPVRGMGRVRLEEMLHRFLVVKDDHGAAEDSKGADRAVEVLELEPMQVLWFTWWREVSDVTNKRERLRSRRKAKGRSGPQSVQRVDHNGAQDETNLY